MRSFGAFFNSFFFTLIFDSKRVHTIFLFRHICKWKISISKPMIEIEREVEGEYESAEGKKVKGTANER